MITKAIMEPIDCKGNCGGRIIKDDHPHALNLCAICEEKEMPRSWLHDDEEII